MKALFCPNCRRKIELPAFVKSGNLQVAGRIKLTCGYCNKEGKGNPKGVVFYAPPKKEPDKVET